VCTIKVLRKLHAHEVLDLLLDGRDAHTAAHDHNGVHACLIKPFLLQQTLL
jgi:hypothetical protein